MHYKSPIPLLHYAGADVKNITVSDLSKIQKRLLVELDLSEDKSLHVDGQTLTKDDILSVIDDLKANINLLYHQWIYDSPYLLKLLQNGDVNGEDRFFDLSLTYHAQFKEFQLFISPYLAQPLGKAINQAFLKREFKKAQDLLVCHYLITDTYFDETFGKLKNSLKALAGEIKRTEQDIHTFKASHFGYINYPFIYFLNALPDQLVPVRDAIINCLINLSVKLEKTEVDFCYNLYQVLKWVKCDEETKKLLFHNYDVFTNRRNQKSATNPVSGCLSAGVIIFVLIVALRACSTSGPTYRSLRTPEPSEGLKISVTDLNNMLLKKSLRSVTGKQMNVMEADFLTKEWITKPSTGPLEDWPYSKMLKDLKTYATLGNKKLILRNTSEYDAILFLHNKENMYSAFLPVGHEVKTNIMKDDLLSVYIGKDWDRTKWFTHKTATSQFKLHGLYSSVDSTTLFYLDRYWKFNCQATGCDSVVVEFSSPVKESFRINDNKEAFLQLDGTGILRD